MEREHFCEKAAFVNELQCTAFSNQLQRQPFAYFGWVTLKSDPSKKKEKGRQREEYILNKALLQVIYCYYCLCFSPQVSG